MKKENWHLTNYSLFRQVFTWWFLVSYCLIELCFFFLFEQLLRSRLGFGSEWLSWLLIKSFVCFDLLSAGCRVHSSENSSVFSTLSHTVYVPQSFRESKQTHVCLQVNFDKGMDLEISAGVSQFNNSATALQSQ